MGLFDISYEFILQLLIIKFNKICFYSSCKYVRVYTKKVWPEFCELETKWSQYKKNVSIYGSLDTKGIRVVYIYCYFWRFC